MPPRFVAMARLLARGIVRAVQTRVELAQVYLESDKAKQGTRSTGKGENKTLPSPIVPPEYPILARRESDQVIDAMLELDDVTTGSATCDQVDIAPTVWPADVTTLAEPSPPFKSAVVAPKPPPVTALQSPAS